MADLLLTRFAISPDGVFGRLLVNGKTYYTVERPWMNNQPRVSCIPNGVYTMRLRHSPVVQRTTGGNYPEGYEIVDVPQRTFIMIHPANWHDQLAGCIAPGREYGPMWRESIGGYQNGVSYSNDSFDELMEDLDYKNRAEHTIDIRQVSMEYP